MASHPSYHNMIMDAVENNQTSLKAIISYLKITYDVDAEVGTKAHLYVKRSLKEAMENHLILKKKGKGLAGSFKLPSAQDRKRAQKEYEAKREQMKEERAAAKQEAGHEEVEEKRPKKEAKVEKVAKEKKPKVVKETSTAKPAKVQKAASLKRGNTDSDLTETMTKKLRVKSDPSNAKKKNNGKAKSDDHSNAKKDNGKTKSEDDKENQ